MIEVPAQIRILLFVLTGLLFVATPFRQASAAPRSKPTTSHAHKTSHIVRNIPVTAGLDDGSGERRYQWAMGILVALALVFSALFLARSKSWLVAVPELALVAMLVYFASIILRPI